MVSFSDVLDIILRDARDFDPRTWVYAVGVSLSVLIALSLTLCILLLRDHYLDLQEKRAKGNSLDLDPLSFSSSINLKLFFFIKFNVIIIEN